jgi:hypothetical protein
MARDKRTARGPDELQGQQEEMTVIVLKLRGDSQTLQRGFDVVSQALSSLGSRHHSVTQRQPPPLPSADGEVIDNETQHSSKEAGDEDAAQETSVPGNGKAKRSSSAPKYKFLDDFDLSPNGKPSLKDYCTEKDPQTEQDKFLVATAWIQIHGETNPFTGDHLFTCFRAMEWDTQGDLVQRLRNSKFKKSHYDNPGRGQWRLTNIGLEAAENIRKE